MENYFIIRTPTLPINLIEQLYLIEFPQNEIIKLFRTEIFNCAIYLASPSFYNELIIGINSPNFRISEKQKNSLLKYLIRSACRATPFGLFSGIHVGCLTDLESNIIVKDKLLCKIGLDYDLVYSERILTCELNQLNDNVIVYSNNSLYRLGNEWRFIEYNQVNGSRVFKKVWLKSSEILDSVIDLSKGGIQVKYLLKNYAIYKVTKKELYQFIKVLIQNQILITEFSPNLTGLDYSKKLFYRISDFLNGNSEMKKFGFLFNKIIPLKLDQPTKENDLINKLVSFKSILKKNGFLDLGNFTGVNLDYERVVLESKINKEVFAYVPEAATLLNSLCDKEKPIHAFFEKFKNKYENNIVPLPLALDEDKGIDYMKICEENYNHSIYLNEEINEYKLNIYSKYLTSKYIEVNLEEFEININTKFRVPDNSFFYGDLLNYQNKYNLIWKCLGASAVRMIGRFGYLSPKIDSICKEFANNEEKLFPEIIFAEISHFPEGKGMNILAHPKYYSYQIAYLSAPDIKNSNILDISDLYLCVKNGELILFSKYHKKRVIPRLSNAHNFPNSNLPIYRFLCDLQYPYENTSIDWDWGLLKNRRVLPRITYKNIIISPAIYNLNIDDFKGINSNNRFDCFTLIRKKLGIPDKVILKSFDNGFLLNLDSNTGIDLFLNLIRNLKKIVVTESFNDTNNTIVKDGNGNGYISEIILPILTKANAFRKIKALNVNLDFFSEVELPILSDWIYFKIYCSPATADRLLQDELFNLKNNLLKSNIIDKWFFIRYYDSSYNLRIRFHIIDGKFNEFRQHINQNFERIERIVNNVQIESYEREYQRYNDIEFAESLFFYNSEISLNLIELTNKYSFINRDLAAVIGVHEYLNLMGVSTFDRINLLNDSLRGFNKSNTKESARFFYRINLKAFNEYNELNMKNMKNDPLFKLKKLYKSDSKKLSKQIKNKYVDPLLIQDFIHLFINRLMISNHYYYESIFYKFLIKYYSVMLKQPFSY